MLQYCYLAEAILLASLSFIFVPGTNDWYQMNESKPKIKTGSTHFLQENLERII